ncbi:hypothetical protein EK904_007843 [Melospiza melodia maxima]|nr:hypothetical protein EK904_007843 [Melospiza melodia maxima]
MQNVDELDISEGDTVVVIAENEDGWMEQKFQALPYGCLQCFAQALVLLPSSPSTSTVGLEGPEPLAPAQGWDGTEGSRVRAAALPRLKEEERPL